MPPSTKKYTTFKYKGKTGKHAAQLLEADLRKFDVETLNKPLESMKTKSKRKSLVKKQLKLKKLMRELVRKKRQLDGLDRKIPLTQELKRKSDVTMVTEEHLPEIQTEEQFDEFSSYFKGETTPKLLITTGWDGIVQKQTRPSKNMLSFIRDLLAAIPNSFYVPRRGYYIKQMVEYCKNREFTDIWVIGQRNGKPYRLTHVHLPDGPTATYRLSTSKNSKQIKKHARSSEYAPELILNNFSTRLGLRVARMIQCIFPLKPEFVGRRVVTFHNQRDFIFFRHHRYEFVKKQDEENVGGGKKKGNKVTNETDEYEVNIQEIGPRFTMRLESLQLGIFDTQFGEYEWKHSQDMEDARTRFFL
jgi:ribosome production factor 1